MTAKSFAMLAAIIFAIGAVVQFLRIAMEWTVVVTARRCRTGRAGSLSSCWLP
jgi:hypothetical protein